MSGKWDTDKIRQAAFRCQIWEWMERNASGISHKAYEEMKEILERDEEAPDGSLDRQD